MKKKNNKIPKFKTRTDEIIWNNVMEITKAKNISKAELARRIKVDPQYFTKIESAITGIGNVTLKRIMKTFDIKDVSELLVPPGASKPIPIIDWNEALFFSHKNVTWPEGVSSKGERVIPHEKVSPSAFALKVPANLGMEPRVTEGDLIVVDPSVDVANGDVCLVEVNGEVKCRYVFFESVIRLVALNQKYPELHLKEEADFRIKGR